MPRLGEVHPSARSLTGHGHDGGWRKRAPPPLHGKSAALRRHRGARSFARKQRSPGGGYGALSVFTISSSSSISAPLAPPLQNSNHAAIAWSGSDAAIRFDVSPDCLIGLKKASVPDEVVRAMMARVRESQKIPAPTVLADSIANANQSLAKFEMDQPSAIMPSLGVRPSAVSVNPMDKADAGTIRVSPPNLNQMAPVVPSAEPGTYGLRSGSVAGFGAAGVAYSSGVTGVHPTFGGGLEVGLSRYFGVFGEGGYSRMLNESVTACYYGCVSVTRKPVWRTLLAAWN
jgi:hypothetical protein